MAGHRRPAERAACAVLALSMLMCMAGYLYVLSIHLQGEPPLSSTAGRLLEHVPFLHQQDALLAAALRAAALKPNNTVIITTFTGPWDDLLKLWLERIQMGSGTSKYLRHILVLCMDAEAYAICRNTTFLHCYHDIQRDKKEVEAFGGTALNYGTKGMVHMMWRRLELLSKVIHLGFNLLLSDIDVIWFKDPFPWLGSHSDVTFSCDKFYDDPKLVSPNGGFWFARSNVRTRTFFTYWLKDHETRWPETEAHMHEQEAFRQLRPEVNNYTANVIGLTASYLPTSLFASFCQSAFQVSDLVTFHPTCLLGKERKRTALESVLRDYDEERARAQAEDTDALPSLAQVVEAAAGNEALVILTSLPPGQERLLDLFVDRLLRRRATEALLAKLVVVTFDLPAYQHCLSRITNCYFDKGVLAACPGRGDKDLQGVCLTVRRLQAAHLVLSLGCSVLYSHLSLIWLQNPIPMLQADADFQVAVRQWEDEPAQVRVDEGFWFARSTQRSKQFLAFWEDHLDLRLHPYTPADLFDAETLERILPNENAYVADSIGLTMSLLGAPQFGSLCQPSAALAEAAVVEPSCLRREQHAPEIQDLLHGL